MSRKITDGNAVSFITSETVEEGNFYNIDNILGLCLKSAEIGELTSLEIGLYEYESTQIVDQEYLVGNMVYWNNTTKLFTITASDVIVGKVTRERVVGEPLVLRFIRIIKTGFPA